MNNFMKLYFIGMFHILYAQECHISTILQKYCYENYNEAKCIQTIDDEVNTKNVCWNKILPIWDKICANNNSQACWRVGFAYSYLGYTKVKVDLKKSIKYYAKACMLKNGKACNNLGVLYKYGLHYKHRNLYFEQNLTKALYYFEKACNSEDAVEKGCDNKQETIDMLKERGTYKKAVDILKRDYAVDISE